MKEEKSIMSCQVFFQMCLVEMSSFSEIFSSFMVGLFQASNQN